MKQTKDECLVKAKTRLKDAYLLARKQREIVEIELNRSSIVLMSKDGKMIRVPMLHEH